MDYLEGQYLSKYARSIPRERLERILRNYLGKPTEDYDKKIVVESRKELINMFCNYKSVESLDEIPNIRDIDVSKIISLNGVSII